METEDDRDNNLEAEGEEAGNLEYNGQCVVDDVENRVLTIENRVRDHPAFVSKKLTIKGLFTKIRFKNCSFPITMC